MAKSGKKLDMRAARKRALARKSLPARTAKKKAHAAHYQQKYSKEGFTPVTQVMIDVTGAIQDMNVRTLRFGMVTVSNTVPDAATLKVNVGAGRDALTRAKAALIRPGVKLHHGADVPTFRVEPGNPKILIREVNGRVDRGTIVNGTFIPAD